MKKTVLIVDDELSIRKSLEGILKDENYAVLEARDGYEALKIIKDEDVDAVLLDIWMEGMDGLTALEKIRAENQDLPVIMISGHGKVDSAVKAIKLGAFDFIEKPLSLDKVIVTLSRAIEFSKLEEENIILKDKFEKKYELLGGSPAITNLKEQVKKVAPTNAWVLITGENGTGKELVARMIHRISLRGKNSFVDVNCAAIPEELIESELFGHEKGSFTGAISKKRGKFDLANEGTLFLDEIGDMSLKTQAKILRILQEQKFERVGGTKTIEVNVRVIAASNKNLAEEIKRGNFREDLFFRLNVVQFCVPPLRERVEDISLLADYFLGEFSNELKIEKKELSDSAVRALQKYSWPGNVRELKNCIERVTIMAPGRIINEKDIFFSYDIKSSSEADLFRFETLKDAREEFEKEFILKKLKEFDNNITKTAEVIGVERSHLHRKIKGYGIHVKN